MRFWSAFIIFTWITGWQKLRGPINGIQKVSNVLKIAKKKGLLWWTLYYTAITVLASRDAIVDNKRALYFRSRFPQQPLYFHSFWEAFSTALHNPTYWWKLCVFKFTNLTKKRRTYCFNLGGTFSPVHLITLQIHFSCSEGWGRYGWNPH